MQEVPGRMGEDLVSINSTETLIAEHASNDAQRGRI